LFECKKSQENAGIYQIEDSKCVSSEFCNLYKRWILPNKDLILRVAMRANLTAKYHISKAVKVHKNTVNSH